MLVRFPILKILKMVLCASAFAGTSTIGLFGAPLSLPSTPYTYTVLDQDLSAALQEFGNNLNVRINISPEVKGRIRGQMPDLTAREFLERLTTLYNLQWYYDGLVLYVSAAQEAQSRLFVLNTISFDDFKAALDAFKISDERYIVRSAPGDGIVMIFGPPRFITLVEQTLNGLLAEAQARPSAAPVEKQQRDSVLMLFRGDSTTIVRDGRQEGTHSSEAPHQENAARAPAARQRTD